MFTHIYGLQTTPFTRALSTGDILATASVKELQARLTQTVRERGIALVTGDVGSGKSTAVRAFLASLDPNRHTLVHLISPMVSPSALYRQMLTALNQPIPFGATAQITTLRAVLGDLIQTHRKTPVVVIDEAHLLGHGLLDPLRILISAQLDSQSLAALILRLCWRIHQVASAANGEILFSKGSAPRAKSRKRDKLSATAVRTIWRWVLARPT